MNMKYHVVAVGKRPGLYNTFEDAQQQVNDFPGSQVETCDNLESAAERMRNVGHIPDADIRIYKRAFTKQGSFIPQQSNSFKQEFSLFASSQRLNREEKSKARVNAIREEIIYHYLLEGLKLSQVDNRTGHITLTPDQELRIYQAVCQQLGKTPYGNIDECKAELKRPPYVNILDFVDVFRTGDNIRTFSDPHVFLEYTRENPVHLGYAKESTFLSAFLQNLGQLSSKFRRGYQGDGSRPELQSQKYPPSSLLRSHRPTEKPIKSEIPNGSCKIPLVSSRQSHLDLPPLSPQSECSSSSFSYRDASPSRATSPVSPSSTPFSSPDSRTTFSHIKCEATPPPPKPAQVLDCDLAAFLEDDEEIATQLSQQPSKAELEEDLLEDMIQDDEEISTQLTQEWHDTDQEVSSRTKIAGKRRRGMSSRLDSPAKRACTMLETNIWSSASAMSAR